MLWFLVQFLIRWGLVAAYLHWSQGYLISSCFDALCILSRPSWELVNWHWSQEYFIPSCLDSLCILRFPGSENVCSHWSQEYLIPSCLDLCHFRFHLWDAVYSHLSQEYLIPSCLDLLWWINVDSRRLSTDSVYTSSTSSTTLSTLSWSAMITPETDRSIQYKSFTRFIFLS